MSNHLDKEEFFQAIRSKHWGLLWSAYQYACRGVETPVSQLAEREAERRIKVLENAFTRYLVEHARTVTTKDEAMSKVREWVRIIEQEGYIPCCTGCPGVVVQEGEFKEPEGYVHVERCDSCNRFGSSYDAAECLVGEEGVFCTCIDCDDIARRALTVSEAEKHVHFVDVREIGRRPFPPRLRVIIKKKTPS